MEIAVDSTLWPLVRVTYPAKVTSGDVMRLAAKLAAIHRSHGPMAVVADIEGLSADLMTPLLRAKIAEEADRLAEQGALLAEAVVVKNPVLRAIHRGYTWARCKQDYPARTFSTLRAAMSWAEQLAPAGR